MPERGPGPDAASHTGGAEPVAVRVAVAERPSPIVFPEPAPTEPPAPTGETPPEPPPTPEDPPPPSDPPTEPGDPAAPLATIEAPREPLKVVLVNESTNVEDRARDESNAELTGKQNIIQKVWAGFTRAYREQKTTERKEKAIKESGSMFGDDEAGRAKQAAFAEREIDRFKDERYTVDGTLTEIERFRKDALEERTELNDTPAQAEAKAMVKDLLRDLVTGELDAANFEEARSRLLSELTDKHPDLAGNKDLMFSDNLLKVAEQIKAREETKEAQLALIEQTEVVLGQSRALQRTEAKYSGTDKLVELMEKIPGIGKVVLANETAVAVGIAAATSVLTFGGNKVAAAAKVGLIGLGSAAVAGMRERKQFTDKRTQHMRESAVGEQAQEGDKQRETLEDTRYSARDAREMHQELIGAMTRPEAVEGEPPPPAMTPERFQAAVTALGEIKARLTLSDTQDVDLISYTSVDKVITERDQLWIDVATAEVFLQRFLDASDADPRLAESLGGGTLKASVEARMIAVNTVLRQDIESKDSDFRAERRKAVVTRMAIAGLTGAAFGAVIQEAAAHLPVPGGHRVGLFEKRTGGTSEHHTALRKLQDMFTGEKNEVKLDPSELKRIPLDGSHELVLPKDVQIKGSEGNFSLFRDNKLLAENVHLRGDTLDPASAERLRGAGVLFREHENLVTTHHEGVDKIITPQEHAAQNGQHIKRLWQDNDTKRFDKNELKLDLKVDPATNHVYYDAGRMTQGGSYHNGVNSPVADMFATDRGKLLVSDSRATQATPTVFDMHGGRADLGEINNNPYVTMVNGKPKLSAAFAEVGDPTGEKVGDVQRYKILATDKGPGLTQVRVPGQDFDTTELHRTLEVYGFDQEVTTDLPYVIPIPYYSQLDSTTRPEAPAPEPGVPTTGETEPPPPESPPERRILPLWEVKEEARKALAAMEALGSVTPAERRRVAAQIGRTTQSMQKEAVNGTGLISLFAVFHSYEMALVDQANAEAAAKRAAGTPEAEVEAERTDKINAYRSSMQLVVDSITDAAERQQRGENVWEVGTSDQKTQVKPGDVIPAGQVFPEVTIAATPETASVAPRVVPVTPTPNPVEPPAPEPVTPPAPATPPVPAGPPISETERAAQVGAAYEAIDGYRARLASAQATNDADALLALRDEAREDNKIYRDPVEGETGRQPQGFASDKVSAFEHEIDAAIEASASEPVSAPSPTPAPVSPSSGGATAARPMPAAETAERVTDERGRQTPAEIVEPILQRYDDMLKDAQDNHNLGRLRTLLSGFQGNNWFYRDARPGESARQPRESIAGIVSGFESKVQAAIAAEETAPVSEAVPSVTAEPQTEVAREWSPDTTVEAQIAERILSDIRIADEAGDLEKLRRIRNEFPGNDRFFEDSESGRQPKARLASTVAYVQEQVVGAIDRAAAKKERPEPLPARQSELVVPPTVEGVAHQPGESPSAYRARADAVLAARAAEEQAVQSPVVEQGSTDTGTIAKAEQPVEATPEANQVRDEDPPVTDEFTEGVNAAFAGARTETEVKAIMSRYDTNPEKARGRLVTEVAVRKIELIKGEAAATDAWASAPDARRSAA